MFSDEDVKRLKERSIHHDFGTNSLMSREHFDALLTRLDAAEKALAVFHANHGLQDAYVDYDKADEMFTAWLSAAGKGTRCT